MISVLQELRDPMSLGKWSKLYNYTVQLPVDTNRKLET